MTRLVSFDAGGVLVSPDWTRVSAVLAAQGVGASPARLARADAHAKLAMDRPALVSSTNNAGHGTRYYAELMRAVGVPDPTRIEAALRAVMQEHARRNLWDAVGPDVVETLSRLRARGARLIVVSNSDGRLRRLLETAALAGFFDAIVDSAEVGVEKPDPRIFAQVLASLGVAAADAMHVGDFYEIDVVGARAAGLTPVLLDPLDLHGARGCRRITRLRELEID